MDRRKKLAVIGTVIIIGIVAAIVWQVIDVNQRGKSPLEALFAANEEGDSESSTAVSAEPVTIILREEAPTPSPTPIPTATPTPTPEPTKKPEPVPVFPSDTDPDPVPETGTSSAVEENSISEVAVPTPEPTPVVTPTPRPEVIETTPEPTPVPEVTEITLDTYTVNILAGDSWRINIVSAPSSLRDVGATWTTGNSSVVTLAGSDTSGVTITGIAPGETQVTVYSRDGLSASCTVVVSE